MVTEKVRVTDITWREVSYPYFFRRYACVGVNDDAGVAKITYFKEFGDPRMISRVTGKAYADLDAMKIAEPGATPATEILHFTIPTPASPYGVPRWIANLPGVLGSRELDTVNLNYFKNNVVPPLALLCSGGRFGKGVATRIEEFIEEHLKGKKGINRILVLEAEGQKASGDPGPRTIPKLQFVPLRDVQQTDALFQNYDIRNEEKVAKSFRLPRILRGDDSQTNRATAWASLKFAEEEVFEPERQAFDSILNRRILPVLDITFWIFRSNAPIVRDPEAMAEMVVNLVKVGVLTLGEGRDMCKDIFNRAFVEISEDWTGKPLPFLLAQLNLGTLDMNTPNGRGLRDLPVPPAARTGPAPAPTLVQGRAGTPRVALGSADPETAS
jgi:capsid portal protein